MSGIALITDGERGDSVRAKLNALIEFYSAGAGADYLAKDGSVLATEVLNYATDVSGSFGALSLINKAYADATYVSSTGGYLKSDGSVNATAALNYASDVSGSYTLRSLIDKGYAASTFAPIVSGGYIAANGSVNATAPVNYASDVSGSYTLRSLIDKGYAAATFAPIISGGYVPLSGSVSMTGQFNLSADATTSLQPVTFQQLQAWQIGLWDDRGTFTPSGSYPSTGGSGTSGAILKGDIWTINGLGAGVAGTVGTKTVYDGDTVRALINTPGSTDANWGRQEGALGYVALSNTLNSANLFVGNSSNVAAGVALSLNATPGTFSLSNAGVLTMPNATNTLRGLISSTDWNTFNNKIDNTVTTLSNLVSVSTLTTGTWNASVIGGQWGGTGVNNSGKTITLGGNLSTSGAYALILTLTAATNVTLPTSGTLATLAGAETWTNKRITLRIGTETTNTVTSINTDNYDVWTITALASADTISTTGTPTDGQKLTIRIKDAGVAKALTFTTGVNGFRFSSDYPAPTTTIISKTMYIGFMWNAADSRWDNVSPAENNF